MSARAGVRPRPGGPAEPASRRAGRPAAAASGGWATCI